MTDNLDNPRVVGAPAQAVHVRTEPRPDGSTVLVLLTPGPPLVLIEHRMVLDRYLTWALLHTLTRDLDGLEPPGPTPETAALLNALASGNPDDFAAALDAYHARILNLWTDRGAAA